MTALWLLIICFVFLSFDWFAYSSWRRNLRAWANEADTLSDAKPPVLTSREPVQAVATCRNCGLVAHHLISDRHTVVDVVTVFQPDPDDPGEVAEISVWGQPRPVRQVIHGGGQFVEERRQLVVVTRECRECGTTWEELA